MSTQSFNPDSYKNGQEQEWDAAAAGWRKQWAVFETSAQSVNDRLVDLAEIKPEDRVLDVVTGIGEPAVTAAKFVGAGGRVVATDQSTGMLAIAKERVAEFGLNNVEFQATDAEALDFPEGSFDAVVCRWGLMFLPDVGAALSEIRKSLFPRGKFVTSVWGLPPVVPMASIPMGILQRELQLSPPPPGAPTLFTLGAPGAIESAFKDAGFVDVHVESMSMVLQFATGEEYTEFMRDIAAPINAMVNGQPQDRQTELWGMIADAARELSNSGGSISMPNETILVAGRRE